MYYDTKEEILLAAEDDFLLYSVLRYGRLGDLTYQETLEAAVLALSKANKFHQGVLIKMTKLTIQPLIISKEEPNAL